MLNKVILMGRLTADVELRHTQTGTAVASFTLAVERDFKDKATGERAVGFIDIVAWRGTAEFASRYFSKGRMAAVEGSLNIRVWTDKDGNKRRNAEVIADSLYFADAKRETGGEGYSGGEPAENTASRFDDLEDNDASLPF